MLELEKYKKCTILQMSQINTFEVIMGVPIRINEDIYNDAKKVARAECRSIPNQIEFWAKIGKCALENPDLPTEFIKELLISKNTDRSLAEPFDFDEGSGD